MRAKISNLSRANFPTKHLRPPWDKGRTIRGLFYIFTLLFGENRPKTKLRRFFSKQLESLQPLPFGGV